MVVHTFNPSTKATEQCRSLSSGQLVESHCSECSAVELSLFMSSTEAIEAILEGSRRVEDSVRGSLMLSTATQSEDERRQFESVCLEKS